MLLKLKTLKKISISAKKVALYVIVAVFLAILFRVFVGEVYKVPSASMENTIKTNDIIWVNKLKYGALLPCALSEVPFINSLFKKNNSKLRSGKRFFGYSAIQRNDIIVFDSPGDTASINLVKRCIGLPGETISIKYSKVSINGNFQKEKDGYKFDYLSLSNSAGINTYLRDSMKIVENPTKDKKNGGYLFNLTTRIAKELARKGFKLNRYSGMDHLSSIFPIYMKGKWKYSNYGPLWIPQKNRSIIMNDSTIAIYGKTIERFENAKIIKHSDGRFYIDKQLITEYRFKNDYYFVLGDNRDIALDSRYFGFIPTPLIQGVVTVII